MPLPDFLNFPSFILRYLGKKQEKEGKEALSSQKLVHKHNSNDMSSLMHKFSLFSSPNFLLRLILFSNDGKEEEKSML